MREPAITEQRDTTVLNNATDGQCVAKRSHFQLEKEILRRVKTEVKVLAVDNTRVAAC